MDTCFTPRTSFMKWRSGVQHICTVLLQCVAYKRHMNKPHVRTHYTPPLTTPVCYVTRNTIPAKWTKRSVSTAFCVGTTSIYVQDRVDAIFGGDSDCYPRAQEWSRQTCCMCAKGWKDHWPRSVRAIADGVALFLNILQLKHDVECCLLLYCGSNHSQSFASVFVLAGVFISQSFCIIKVSL